MKGEKKARKINKLTRSLLSCVRPSFAAVSASTFSRTQKKKKTQKLSKVDRLQIQVPHRAAGPSQREDVPAPAVLRGERGRGV